MYDYREGRYSKKEQRGRLENETAAPTFEGGRAFEAEHGDGGRKEGKRRLAKTGRVFWEG